MLRARFLVFVLALLSLVAVHGVAMAQAPYPVIDKLAAKVVAKYQNSSCAQLAAEKGQKPTGEKAAVEQHAIQYMHQNPQAAQEFIGKVATPIANKLFACGLIP
jgi:ABC-type Fe2+-enterobactin transport system substrate-binding protein